MKSFGNCLFKSDFIQENEMVVWKRYVEDVFVIFDGNRDEILDLYLCQQ